MHEMRMRMRRTLDNSKVIEIGWAQEKAVFRYRSIPGLDVNEVWELHYHPTPAGYILKCSLDCVQSNHTKIGRNDGKIISKKSSARELLGQPSSCVWLYCKIWLLKSNPAIMKIRLLWNNFSVPSHFIIAGFDCINIFHIKLPAKESGVMQVHQETQHRRHNTKRA